MAATLDMARHLYKESALQAHNLAMEKCIEYGILELRPRSIENVEVYFNRTQHED